MEDERIPMPLDQGRPAASAVRAGRQAGSPQATRCPVKLGQVADDGEPQPTARHLLIGAYAALQDRTSLCCGQSLAVVVDGDPEYPLATPAFTSTRWRAHLQAFSSRLPSIFLQVLHIAVKTGASAIGWTARSSACSAWSRCMARISPSMTGASAVRVPGRRFAAACARARW